MQSIRFKYKLVWKQSSFSLNFKSLDLAFRLINIHKRCLVKLALISLCALFTGIIVMFAFACETFSIVQILVIIMEKNVENLPQSILYFL